MAEKNSPTPEKTVVVKSNHLGWLWTLTIISLALNGLILLLLVVGFIFHHHHHHHGFGGGRWGRGEECSYMAERGGFGHGFHHFGGEFGEGPEMMHHDFGPGMMGGGPDMMHHDFGPGMMGGGPGMMHHGFGPGMMGEHGQNGPPDPAKMADMMLDHLSAKLSLTDDEKAKIKPIIQAQADQMQKDMEAARQAHQKAMEDTKAKIKALLTPDQQKLLDDMPQPGAKPADQAKPTGP